MSRCARHEAAGLECVGPALPLCKSWEVTGNWGSAGERQLGALIQSWGLELPECHKGWGQGHTDDLRQCGLLMGWQQGDGISSSATSSTWIVISRAGFGGSGVHISCCIIISSQSLEGIVVAGLRGFRSQGDAVTGAHCSLHT